MRHVICFFAVLGFLFIYIVGSIFDRIGDGFKAVGRWCHGRSEKLFECMSDIGQKEI